MKMIVAGLGRTGTQSLVAALDQLGLRTLSQENLFADVATLERFTRMVRGEEPFAPAVADGTLNGVDATVGWPLCWLFEEQLEHFPNAICLLNTRDADAWYDSVERVMRFVVPMLRLAAVNRRVRAVRELFGVLTDKMGGPPERSRWTAAYVAHANAVRAAVPAERLVEYSIGAGWAPLCDALGCRVPDTPFPNTNASASGSFERRFARVLGIQR